MQECNVSKMNIIYDNINEHVLFQEQVSKKSKKSQ